MWRSIEQLVNQQVLRWTEAQRVSAQQSITRDTLPPVSGTAAGSGPSDGLAQVDLEPTICISREFGTYAAELAREVAARIGFDVYDQELVDEISRQAHVRRKVVESLDERVQHGLSAWVDELMELRSFTPSDYLRNLSQVVLTIGRHGRGILIGRGAHLILNPSHALRIRCYAPLDWRIQRVAEREGLSTAKATALTARVDAERVQFYREHFRTDFYDPSNFDVLINASTTPLAARAELIVQAFEAKFAPTASPSLIPVSGVRAKPQLEPKESVIKAVAG
ncbi:MAG TPA: cytidylate kinase-like family protein [Polyangiaceae bacterium]|nr:cytidylate kinase-like family protein [Polyangiaceae bacterium]